MNKKWWKKGVAALTVMSLTAGAIGVYAQDTTAEPPATGLAAPYFGGPGFGGFRGNGALSIVADQLGIKPTELWTELQSGKSIADLAGEKGVETSVIVDAIVAAQQERLTTAVTDGRLTQAQADARLALAKADADALLTRTFELPDQAGFGPRGGLFRFGGDLLSVAAEQLGIEESQLRTEMQSGKSIADLAEEKGVETSAIVDALVTAHQEKLDQAVADGTLTQEQADARIENFKTAVQNFIDHTLPQFGMPGYGFGPRGHRPGMGGPGGMWPGNGNRPGGMGRPGGNHGYPGYPPAPPADAPDAPAAPDSTSTPNA